MSTAIYATYVDGVFKPDEPVNLPPQTRVRLMIVDPMAAELSPEEREAAWGELEQLWEEAPIDSGGPIPTREELYDRPSLRRLMYPEQQKEDR
jgi:predicted DNA-binding antitoxin AbrB/MazE fold protein